MADVIQRRNAMWTAKAGYRDAQVDFFADLPDNSARVVRTAAGYEVYAKLGGKCAIFLNPEFHDATGGAK